MLEKDLQKIKEHAPGYVSHWIYKENERPVLLVARYELYQKKTYRQFHWEEGEWREGMPQAPYPLFGLITLQLTSPFDGPIICEGEKCAAVLHQFGWPALATALGASNVSNSDLTPLRHFKQFVILRDNDNAGIEFCRKVAVQLRRIYPNVNISVCNLTPDLPGGDVVDWIQSKPLYGRIWDGFQPLPADLKVHVEKCLFEEIKLHSKPIEECNEIGFDQSLSLFDGDPRPFQSQLRPVPAFPLESFPIDVSDFIETVSRQFSLPPDFAGTIFLALIGGIIGRSLMLDMRIGQEWSEASNLWAILVGNPSAKKSPIYRRVSKLLSILEKAAEAEHRQAVKDYQARKRKAKTNQEEFDEDPPIMRRYTTNDCTIPKLCQLMAGNPRGLILHNDELKGQLEKFEKPGSEGDRSFMMQCWSGLEHYNEDRMTRLGGFRVPLCLSWIGCIPPTALAAYLREAQSYGSGADGFMQRFQMVTYPDVAQTYTICNELIPARLQKKMEACFQVIDQEALKNSEKTLHFDEQAQTIFDNWHVSLENDCRSSNHPTYWESHLGKQPKLLASLCIILHRLFDAQSRTNSNTINVPTLEAALKLQRYFQEHAKRCYESITSIEINDAKKILELIQQKRLPERFKAQDIYRQGLGGLKDSQRVRNALELLRDSDWLALEKIQGHTGKASEFWIAHPKATKTST